MTEPTDAEILDAADDFRSQYMHGGITFDEFDSIGFARAVLDKWGTPPAVAGEPVAIYHGRCVIDCGEHGHLDMEMLKMIPAGSKLYATPQPTQEQAGAVPLTDAQSHALIERMANEVEQWAEGLSYEPTQEQLSGWCVAFIQREIHFAHGIKQGGQHG